MKTIEGLLAEGRRLLEEKRRHDSQIHSEYERKARESWGQLRIVAFGEMGELAERLPEEPPPGFQPDSLFALVLEPWGVPCLRVYFLPVSGSWQKTTTERYGRCYCRVTWRWKLCWDDEAEEPSWVICPEDWRDYETLPEAIVAAAESVRQWGALADEAEGKPSPVAEPMPAARKPALTPTAAETGLLLALRQLLAEREGEE